MPLLFFIFVIALLIYSNNQLYKQIIVLRYCYIDMSDAYINKITEFKECAAYIENKEADFNVDVLIDAVGAAEMHWDLKLDKHLKEMRKVKLSKFAADEKADYVLNREKHL